jgi:hypothetical protein
LEGGIAEAFDDYGAETQPTTRDGIDKTNQRQQPNLRIQKRLPNLFSHKRPRFRAGLVFNNALQRDDFFFGGEPACCGWVIGDDEQEGNAPDDGDGAEDEVDEFPGRKTAFDVTDSESDKAADCAEEAEEGDPERGAGGLFMACPPDFDRSVLEFVGMGVEMREED